LGALDSTANQFRNYAVAGTSLATGGFGTIPPQFEQAVTANPVIKLSIMDGGGNDILLCDTSKFPACDTSCSTSGSSTKKVCTDIVNGAATVAEQLMTKMANAGVKDIIYFFYPRLPAKGGGYKEILDYAEPLAKQTCDNTAAMTGGKLTCHFVDLVQPFQAAGGDMNPANFSFLDGVHPSQAGQDIVAQQIWDTMKKDCLGQPLSSDCCSP
jgi:phospholipase/lecithinase/hemolysin